MRALLLKALSQTTASSPRIGITGLRKFLLSVNPGLLTPESICSIPSEFFFLPIVIVCHYKEKHKFKMILWSVV